MTPETFNQKFAGELPDVPGVYFFLDAEGTVLYIGKATSLRDRVKSYFTQDILLTRGPKIVRMLELAVDIKWRETDSALEALLLEANLIHRHRPPYNTDAKDDKSWNFVVITKEKFPRVLIERGKKLESLLDNSKVEQKEFGYSIKKTFGPFPSGGSLKEAVNIVRKIFPFRDVCMPLDNVQQKKDVSECAHRTARSRQVRRGTGGCFNYQIGLCPGVCVGAVSAREYGKMVRNIELFFAGKKITLVRNLEREMKSEAKALHFERAGELKKTLFALAHIQDVALLKRNMFGLVSEPSLRGDFSESGAPSPGGFDERRRIEAYDVAHLGGADTVGVMTVVSGGEAQKSEYRKFLIRETTNGNDFAALEELLRRRFGHSEWPFPDLVVVDGSHLQRHVAESVLRDFALDIPVVSVVKNEHHQPKGILGPKKERDAHRDAVLLANSESHRFAISFHRKRRGKSFLKQ